MLEVYRKEKKFLISSIDFYRATHFLDQFMISDVHNKADGYNIRSLYFDTLNDKDYNDKDLGKKERRKIRLRIYEPSQSTAKLEIKQKDGDYQLKRSLTVNRDDAMELIKGNYNVLFNYKEKIALECYAIMHTQCYRPKAVVEYNRRAFIAKENDIRITFDFAIRTNEVNYNIFDPNLVLNRIFDSSNIVLEVKYNGFLLSYIRNFLKDINKSETSVSKYCIARHTTQHDIFY